MDSELIKVNAVKSWRLYVLVISMLMLLIGMGALRLLQSLETQHVQTTVQALNRNAMTQFAELDRIIGIESTELKSRWHQASPQILENLNLHPFLSSPFELRQVAEQLGVDGIFLINAKARITASSDGSAVNLDLNTVSAALGKKLIERVGSGDEIVNHLGLSNRTGRLMIYHYYAPRGQHYWLETATELRPFLAKQHILSDRYPLLTTFLKTGLIGNASVKNVDLVLQRPNGNYSIFSEKITDSNLAVLSAGQQLIEAEGDVVHTHSSLPLSGNMAYSNVVLSADIDVSPYHQMAHYMLLALFMLYVVVLLILYGVWRYTLRQFEQRALAVLHEYENSADVSIAAKDLTALRQYAAHLQQVRQNDVVLLQKMQQVADLAANQRTQALEVEIARRRESEATLAELRLGLEMANRRLIEANTLLMHDAETDPLTGCGNRRFFEQMAAVEMSRAQRYLQPVCLLMIDIDFFKRVNDQYGHQMGDQVLIALADALRRHLRQSDLLCRWGGEEFALLVPSVTLEQGKILAEKLRISVADHLFPHQQPLTISIGLAVLGDSIDVEAWVEQADQALYRAKAGGRNRVELA